VAAGHPVIVLQNLGLAWIPLWHYAVVIGIDPIGNHLILHSGRMAHKETPAGVFTRTWARSGFWAMVVLPPGTLPVSLDETGCLRAVSAMEQLSRWTVAAGGYQAILDRWPDSLTATIGLGVCLYRSADLAAAATVFRNATQQFPHSAVAYNNLAEVLLAQGQRNSALEAAVRAVALGGPLKARFEETLESIRRHP
jgi:tetratricopeptide (TPR) repeat protein